MTQRNTLFGALLASTLFFAATGSAAATPESPCLLSGAELSSFAGRVFADGTASKTAVGTPMCVYSEKDRPRRKLTIEVSSTNAASQFDSRVRLLQRGKASIEMAGIGDRAYFNGTAAGVLKGDTLVAVGQLRRSSDPEISRDNAGNLLRLLAERVSTGAAE